MICDPRNGAFNRVANNRRFISDRVRSDANENVVERSGPYRERKVSEIIMGWMRGGPR
jgi:hypothetical protein